MKFGVREICDVVLKAKATQKVGNKIFYKGEPVIYFDTLKTSSMEGTATSVYAQGGRGNARLMAWEGEKTVTFTMEDALISPAGFMILSGAGLVEGTKDKTLPVHVHEQTDGIYTTGTGTKVYVVTEEVISSNKRSTIYVMGMKNGEIISEPFIGTKATTDTDTISAVDGDDEQTTLKTALEAAIKAGKAIAITNIDRQGEFADKDYTPTNLKDYFYTAGEKKCAAVMVDYYTDRGKGASQIEITADKFGGNYYLEASTLFRNTAGVDMPAEFIIPNCKIQSNFNFSMASSGDPSTFTFTMDAFPDYTQFDETKKVLAAIQIIDETVASDAEIRTETDHVEKKV